MSFSISDIFQVVKQYDVPMIALPFSRLPLHQVTWNEGLENLQVFLVADGFGFVKHWVSHHCSIKSRFVRSHHHGKIGHVRVRKDDSVR